MVLIGATIKSVLRFLTRTTAGDRDNKWSVHYSTQKPPQGLRFIPGKRRSGSADDLRAYNGLTQHDCFKHRPPSPTFAPLCGLDQSEGGANRGWRSRGRAMSSASSDEDEKFFLPNPRPMTPLVLNPISLSSCWDDGFETEPLQRLPTPEEKMRQQAEAVAADIVPINVTGTETRTSRTSGFDSICDVAASKDGLTFVCDSS